MGVVCMLLALSIGRPNPFSFGSAGNEAFDAARPGVVRISRHPLLLALGLWAFAHMVPNGDLAHVLLFGVFALFAGFGGRLVDRRKRREMGEAWPQLRDAVAEVPCQLGQPFTDTALRLGAGLVLYAALIWLHPYISGVSPLV